MDLFFVPLPFALFSRHLNVSSLYDSIGVRSSYAELNVPKMPPVFQMFRTQGIGEKSG
jgi:hypothetical protein